MFRLRYFSVIGTVCRVDGYLREGRRQGYRLESCHSDPHLGYTPPHLGDCLRYGTCFGGQDGAPPHLAVSSALGSFDRAVVALLLQGHSARQRVACCAGRQAQRGADHHSCLPAAEGAGLAEGHSRRHPHLRRQHPYDVEIDVPIVFVHFETNRTATVLRRKMSPERQCIG